MRVSTSPLALALTAAAATLAACGGTEEIPLNIVDFSASATQADAGSTVNLAWSVEGATGVSIWQTPGGELRAGPEATGEVSSRELNFDTTFTLTATSASGESVRRTVEVSVQGINIVSFEATPASIGRGGTATLSWQLGGSPPSEVRVRDSSGNDIIQPSTMPSGSTTVMPNQTETYTLSAQAGGLRAEGMTTVTVMSMPPTIDVFEAQAIVNGAPQTVTTVARGTQIQLRWRVSNVDEVQVSDNGTVRRPWNAMGAESGNVTVTADQARNVYLLEARNGPEPSDLISQELVITTAERPTINSFMVSPMSYALGSTVATAAWDTSGADGTILLVGNAPVPNFPRSASGTFQFDVTGEAQVTLIARNAVGDTTERRQVSFGYADAEPNDAIAQAIPIPADGVPVRGTLRGGDADYYAIMVPENGGVFARVDPPPGGSCSALDPTLTLFDAMGNELGQRTQAGLTRCAEILPPEYSGFAENLSAGMYFLRVTQEAAASTDQYSLDVEIIELSAPLSNVQKTRVGNPSWDVTDFVHTTAAFGDNASMFAELGTTIARFYGSRHRVSSPSLLTYLAAPESPSRSNYAQELRTMLEVLGLPNKNTFSAMEFNGPNGVIMGYTVVPTSTVPGTSRDFPTAPGGPVLSNSILPIDLSIGIFVDVMGEEVNVVQDDGSPRIASDVGADGRSHGNVLHTISGGFFMMPPPAPIDFEWRIQLRDQNATPTGYDLSITTSVVP